MADPPEQAAAQQADAPRANVGDIGRIDLNIAAFVQPTKEKQTVLTIQSNTFCHWTDQRISYNCEPTWEVHTA